MSNLSFLILEKCCNVVLVVLILVNFVEDDEVEEEEEEEFLGEVYEKVVKDVVEEYICDLYE